MTDLTKTAMTRHVAALQAEIEALRHEATHDRLTGLGNRRFLEQRSEGRGGHYVAIDLNGFKRAQDAHPDGHAFGDRVLSAFARLLVQGAGDEDRVACRLGGDEFVVWCKTYRAALRMRALIHRWSVGGVTASAGIGSNLEMADQRCYETKAERARSRYHRMLVGLCYKILAHVRAVEVALFQRRIA